MAGTKNPSWIVPALVGAGVMLIVCSLVAGAGWYLFFRGSATETPEPIAQFIVPTETPTIALATLLPTVIAPTNTPSIATINSPTPGAVVTAPTRPRPTSTPGALSGKIAFSVDRGERPEDKSVWIVNVDGTGAKMILERASSPAFSPDGTKIAYYHWNDGIYVANADGTSPQKIISESNAKFLAWSHDGRWIAFRSQPTRNHKEQIVAVQPDGSGLRAIAYGTNPNWSFDDKQIALVTCKESECGVYRVSSDGGDPVSVSKDSGANPVWSPDGRKILYVVDTNQVKQIFVINADGTEKKPLTSGASMHVSPQWSPDGNYIFYRTPESGAWAIWRMFADGTKPVKIADTEPPSVDWPFEKLALYVTTR